MKSAKYKQILFFIWFFICMSAIIYGLVLIVMGDYGKSSIAALILGSIGFSMVFAYIAYKKALIEKPVEQRRRELFQSYFQKADQNPKEYLRNLKYKSYIGNLIIASIKFFFPAMMLIFITYFFYNLFKPIIFISTGISLIYLFYQFSKQKKKN